MLDFVPLFFVVLWGGIAINFAYYREFDWMVATLLLMGIDTLWFLLSGGDA